MENKFCRRCNAELSDSCVLVKKDNKLRYYCHECSEIYNIFLRIDLAIEEAKLYADKLRERIDREENSNGDE
jgi:transcription elongation factor Elf1